MWRMPAASVGVVLLIITAPFESISLMMESVPSFVIVLMTVLGSMLVALSAMPKDSQ